MSGTVLVIVAFGALAVLAVYVWFRFSSRFFERFARSGLARSGSWSNTTLDDDVQFTVYRPTHIQPTRWYPLLAFVHRAARHDDDPNELDPLAEVSRQAERMLQDVSLSYTPVHSDSLQALPRSGELSLVPEMEGIEFNPARYSFRWEQPVHRADFQLQAVGGEVPRTARGRLTVYLGSLIVGDVPLTIHITETVPDSHTVSPVSGSRYRNVFASYAHEDRAIVQQFDAVIESLGDRYMFDVRDIRAGQVWSAELQRLIEKADIFQLFWSWKALSSPFVRQEWEFALRLSRPDFIRTVYWEDPIPERDGMPPDALRRLHFYRFPPDARISHLQTGARMSWPIILSTATVCILGAAVWSLTPKWMHPAGQLLTLTKPAGGTIVGPGLECGSHGSDCSTTRTAGETVELRAVPDDGYVFSGFTGDCTGTGRLAMTEPRTCSAIFSSSGPPAAPPKQALTINKPSGGSIIAVDIECGTLGSKCSADLPQGVPVTLHARADDGYKLLNFTGDCAPNGETTMAGGRTCGAVFTQLPKAADLPPQLARAGRGPSVVNPGVVGATPAETLPIKVDPTTSDDPISAEKHAKDEIQGLIKSYCTEFETLKAGALKQIFPLLDVRYYTDLFNQYKSLRCTTKPPEYDRLDASPAGAAQVKFEMKQEIVMKSGGAPNVIETIVTMGVTRPNLRSPWHIDYANHAPKPKP